MKDIFTEITDIAKSFLGQEEIRGNLGFKDPKFEDIMNAVGWKKTEAWCAYFGEAVWKIAYQKQNALYFEELDRLFSASAVTTFINFKNAGWYVNSSHDPKPGSLVVWQKYNEGVSHWSGHLGVYINKRSYTHFDSIDGNTNDDGDREGYEVAIKTRRFNYADSNGLVLLGFIEPKLP